MLRFAPSPNGPLHLGHALSLFANETMATSLGLPLMLRMEDIDRARARPEFEAAILDDVAFLGVRWSPPLRRQSDRFSLYADALQQLQRMGLVYPSFATRKEIAAACPPGSPRDPDGALHFPGDERILPAAELERRRRSEAPAAWRLAMGPALAVALVDGPLTARRVDATGAIDGTLTLEPAAWGDVVLARKDTPTSYHLSVVVDDAEQGISHVVRGADLEASTAVHRLLQALLKLPVPHYHHHRLVLGDDGRKLAKSNGAESLGALREAGMSAADIRRRLGYAGAPQRADLLKEG